VVFLPFCRVIVKRLVGKLIRALCGMSRALAKPREVLFSECGFLPHDGTPGQIPIIPLERSRPAADATREADGAVVAWPLR
jgi:hypothetical protein